MKVLFMGTPDFAAGILKELISAGHEILLAVTQPDKKRGRGKNLQMTSVKETALHYGIPVSQPLRIKEAGAAAELRKYPADIYVVAAFGQILPLEILSIPPYGCINVHASLLPKYRGAAPIQWAIINGEEKSGVTIMQMDEGLDTGDMLLWEEVLLAPEETGDSLHDRLMELGGALCVKALAQIEAGEIKPAAQNDAESSYARMLNKEMGRLDFHKGAAENERLIRGLNSWPSAYTDYQGKVLKIWRAEVLSAGQEADAGEVTEISKDSFTVACGQGALRILEVQLEGKRRMSAAEFLRGSGIQKGIRLG